MADIPWLVKLFSEYPTKTKDGRDIRTRDQLLNLREAFDGYDFDVMDDAVKQYMQVGRFFPSIADLYPHVTTAQAASQYGAEQNSAIFYGRVRSDHTEPVSDDELFRHEEARGWPEFSDDELDAMEEARGWA